MNVAEDTVAQENLADIADSSEEPISLATLNAK